MFHKIYNILIETKDIITETKSTLYSTESKLDSVLTQLIETNKLPKGDIQQVIILHDRDAVHNECNLYVLSCQTKRINLIIKKLRAKFGYNIHKIHTINQPNTSDFWKIIKTNLGDELIKDPSSNWFRLSTMSMKEFKDTLQAYEKERKI
jgi:phosphopantetheine adenylyltransferase